MNEPMAKQDKLNRLYAQILKIDEDGKDFLTHIVTQAAAVIGMPDETGPKTGYTPGMGRRPSGND